MTKFASWALICIVALAAFSGVSFALIYDNGSQNEAMLSKGNTEVCGFAKAKTPGFQPMGDPIDDPIPNRFVKH